MQWARVVGAGEKGAAINRPSSFRKASAFLRFVFYKNFETVCAGKDFVHP